MRQRATQRCHQTGLSWYWLHQKVHHYWYWFQRLRYNEMVKRLLHYIKTKLSSRLHVNHIAKAKFLHLLHCWALNVDSINWLKKESLRHQIEPYCQKTLVCWYQRHCFAGKRGHSLQCWCFQISCWTFHLQCQSQNQYWSTKSPADWKCSIQRARL